MRFRAVLAILLIASLASAEDRYTEVTEALRQRGMHELGAYSLLHELTKGVGARLSGSPKAAKAVEWGKSTMERLGFQNVRLVPCMVPHWVRGKTESLVMVDTDGHETPLTCCALGGSVAADGVAAEVVEVHSLDEAAKLGERAKGKFVFYNGPMDPTLLSTFAAYGQAGPQRFQGAAQAAKVGAVGALVRSMTMDPDDVPHTGVMNYEDKVPQVPGAALSIQAANRLHEALSQGAVRVRLNLDCKTLPDEPSASVIGEITGSQYPNKVVVLGGHLDSWDKGEGAHDDGAGVTESLEALRLIRELGLRPKRTIRVVLFMNEENGGRGAEAYAAFAKASGQKAVAGIESDSGGFAPRGFSCSLSASKGRRINGWLKALSAFEAERFTFGGGGGADVGPLASLGAVLFGLSPESQRYFDYHHSDKDTLDKVNPRELELGALSMATLAWLVAEEGI